MRKRLPVGDIIYKDHRIPRRDPPLIQRNVHVSPGGVDNVDLTGLVVDDDALSDVVIGGGLVRAREMRETELVPIPDVVDENLLSALMGTHL
jgi:hypothetical protein